MGLFNTSFKALVFYAPLIALKKEIHKHMYKQRFMDLAESWGIKNG